MKKIRPADGKLGVLLPGLGAVSTTFIAGVERVRKGLSQPIGSLTQMATIRLGKRTEHRFPRIKDFVPLADLDELVFGGWDIFPENAYESACNAGVLSERDLAEVKEFLSGISPWKGVFDQRFVQNLTGTHVKSSTSKMELAEAVIEDIRTFRKEQGVSRLVMVWCGSTEAYLKPSEVHGSLAAFEEGLRKSDPAIPPSMIYAYAALKERIPFANGAPNLTVDIPAMLELARENEVPIAGKDFKTGQTLMKTIISPGLKARMIGLS
ncbi:MAG: inositol-3-phosphate synthase, partial [Deltaproteobacteria bacterium]